MTTETNPMGELALALAKAQASFPTVTRSKTVTVTTKSGGSYKFAYAPLEAILEAVKKPLADNGLVVAQLLDGDTLQTVLLHSSGAMLQARANLPASNDVQGYGSAVTYIRRYAIQALLGIAAEEDDDGNTAVGNEAKTVAAGEAKSGGSLSAKQKALIKIKMREAGLEGQQMVMLAVRTVGKGSTKDMNSADMDKLLEALQDADLVAQVKAEVVP